MNKCATQDEKCRKPAPVCQAYSVSREAEFLNEFDKQIGYPQPLFLLATVKELFDNALDHLEEIGRLPEIRIAMTPTGVEVTDNGDGVPAEVVTRMLDFTTKTSSRALRRCPTRGAMGNAGKCMLAIPYVLSDDTLGRVTIVAQDIRHEIAITCDPVTKKPIINHEQAAVPDTSGTSVTLHIPNLPCILDQEQIDQFVLFAHAAALLNPHVTLTLTLPNGETIEHLRTQTSSTKWCAADPDPPAWHDPKSFEALAGAWIAQDRDSGADRYVQEFMSQFASMKRSDARKAVAEETDINRVKMSELLANGEFDRPKMHSLLASMQRHSKKPTPDKLGCIGRNHAREALSSLGISGDVKYRKVSGETEAGFPFVIEAAFAELEDDEEACRVITGCNFSPSIHKPVVRVLDQVLAAQMIEEDCSVAVLLHIATVNPTFLDRGKSVLSPDASLTATIEEVVEAVTNDYAKRRKREERDADAHEKWLRQRNRSSYTLKDAILAVLPEAIHKASGGDICEFSDRDLYYAARELIQALTVGALTQKHFDSVVDEWEVHHGLIPGRLRDPRGYLLEPHTGRRIPLGTKNVDQYEIPLYLYKTILYVEKKGLLAKFQYGQIGERYDCAIMASEGYAPRAAKALLNAAQNGHKMKILCFHDADPAGYNIARTLSESTGAHNYDIEVIDAGLHLEEAEAMGLATETFTRKKALPKGLVLSPLEEEYFQGEAKLVRSKSGGLTYEYVNCRRVELNALSADPPAFVKWVERKLEQHDVAQKLVPPHDFLGAHASDRLQSVLRETIQARFTQAIGLDAQVERLAREMTPLISVDHAASVVQEWATRLPAAPWTGCIEDLVRDVISGVSQQIDERIKLRC